MELPERVATDDGKIINLDTAEVLKCNDIIDLGGRICNLKEFGSKGKEFVVEMYEQFLSAVQRDEVTTFSKMDKDLAHSISILEYIPDKYSVVKKAINYKTDPDTKEKYAYIRWDLDRKFEEWMVLSLATLKWRYHEDMKRRQLKDGLSEEEVRGIKYVLGECIMSIEVWLALPKRKKLISV